MKLLTTTLAIIIILLLLNNIQLRRTIKQRSKYHTNMSRQEMSDILMTLTGRYIAVFIPADTSVMPYLVKDKK